MLNPKLKEGNKSKYLLAISLLLLSYSIPNAVLNLIKRILFTRWQRIRIKKILILRQGGLGDSVSSREAIIHIKLNFPNAQIDLLTHQKIENRSSIEDILPQNTFNKIYRYTLLPDKDLLPTLKQNGYDLYIELPSYLASFSFELRSILFAKAINAKAAFGWQIGTHALFKKWQEKLLLFERDAERQMNILIDNHLNTNFPLPETDSLNKAFSALPSGQKIALVIGAGRPQNQWPIDSFLQVAQYYIAKGFAILLIGGEKESAMAIQYFQMPGVINLCGQLSPLENLDVLKQCELVISNDSGPMHLAWLAGAPLIAIFSGRDYSNKWYPPHSEINIVLRNNKVPCFTCFSNTCADNICMKTISPEEVIQKADLLIAKT